MVDTDEVDLDGLEIPMVELYTFNHASGSSVIFFHLFETYSQRNILNQGDNLEVVTHFQQRPKQRSSEYCAYSRNHSE